MRLNKKTYSRQFNLYIDYVCNTTDNFEFKCNKTGMCLLSDFRCDGKRDCCDGADPVVFPGADNNTCDDTTDEDDCPGMLGFALPPLCKIALVNQISMSFFYVYQTALVQKFLSNSPRKIMDQERHGNVKIVKNASITKMFAIMKLSVLMAATKWNAVSILDIVKSILLTLKYSVPYT